MLASLVQWLDRIGPLVFWTCAALLVAVNTAAVAAVVSTRSRTLVNRWTGTVLALNAFLLGAGVGIPATAFAAKMVVRAVSPSSMLSITKDVEMPAR